MKTNNKKLIEKLEKIKNRTIFGRGTPISEPMAEAVKENAEQSEIGQDDRPKRKRTKSDVVESVQDEPRPDEIDTNETV